MKSYPLTTSLLASVLFISCQGGKAEKPQIIVQEGACVHLTYEPTKMNEVVADLNALRVKTLKDLEEETLRHAKLITEAADECARLSQREDHLRPSCEHQEIELPNLTNSRDFTIKTFNALIDSIDIQLKALSLK